MSWIIAAEPAVGANDNGSLRPAVSDLRHEAGDLSDAAVGGIDARRTQLGCQQMLAAEDGERQPSRTSQIKFDLATVCRHPHQLKSFSQNNCF
jgi:hypothetical protein